jgi:predicted Zn-dependent peptidase
MIIAVVSPEAPAEVDKYFSPFYKGDEVEVIDGLAHQNEFKLITKPEKIDEEGGGEQSHLFYGFVKEIDKNDVPAVQALSLLLKDDIIFDIREKQGMAYRMSAGIDIVKDKALFYIQMSTRPENTDKLLPQFPGFFSPSFSGKITAEDLERSVNMYLGRMMFRRLSSINQAYYLSYSLYYDGNIKEDQRMLDALKSVTLNEVKSAAEKYLKVENPVQVVVR